MGATGCWCVALGLALTSLQPWGLVPGSAALHLPTVGGIGTPTIGVMARVSIGHTGRRLQVGLPMALAFAAVLAATLVRVLGPWLMPSGTLHALWTAAGLWAAGSALLSVLLLPILTSPRPDGKPG